MGWFLYLQPTTENKLEFREKEFSFAIKSRVGLFALFGILIQLIQFAQIEQSDDIHSIELLQQGLILDGVRASWEVPPISIGWSWARIPGIAYSVTRHPTLQML